MDELTVIVGGGLAGLAAAVALTQRGVPVTLLESRPRLGGRAASFVDRTTGEIIDNCQHVGMGCCTNLQHFCRTVGTHHFFRVERELTFIGPDGDFNRLRSSPLPAPLHLLPAFRKLSYLSQAEKTLLARGLRRLARLKPSEINGRSMRGWLEEQGQTPKLIERFWEVVLVSALSESVDRIDVGYARQVFVNGFLANRHGWEVYIPTVPLDALYGAYVIDWLKRRSGEVRLQAGVEAIEAEGDRVASVLLRTGEHLIAGDFILAVPHHRVLALLPESLQKHPSLDGLNELQSAPISSVHLWFDRPITDLPHAVLVGRLSQWMFNRSRLHAENADPGERGRSLSPSSSPGEDALSTRGSNASAGFNYQVVISASRNLATMSQEETIETVVRELAMIWPAVAQARLLHSRLVTEHRAVFSVTPGVDRLRPVQQSPLANLQLAGDWTLTGWPATMEGAVRSGYLAAENILARRGRPERIVQPDLPPGLLSRCLLGLP